MDRNDDDKKPDDDTFGLDVEIQPHPDPPWPEFIWVKFPADGAPEGGLAYRVGPPRTMGSGGVSCKDSERRDRNLSTVAEFAKEMGCAESSIFELIKRGLPSRKIPGIGRRILRDQGKEWMLRGGATRSGVAKRVRRAAGGLP